MGEFKKYALIVAGGKGLRMGGDVPKQFQILNGKPVLSYSILSFLEAIPDISIILVLPKVDMGYDVLKSVIKNYKEKFDIKLIQGGETRFNSVKNGLNTVYNDGIVFIHDGARPLVSKELIHRCFEQALEWGSAIPAIKVSDSIRIIEENNTKPVNRDNLCIIQTPQTFRTELILPAFETEYSAEFTDDATVVEAFGRKVYLIEGEKRNIKITTPDDMIIASAYLQKLKS